MEVRVSLLFYCRRRKGNVEVNLLYFKKRKGNMEVSLLWEEDGVNVKVSLLWEEEGGKCGSVSSLLWEKVDGSVPSSENGSESIL